MSANADLSARDEQNKNERMRVYLYSFTMKMNIDVTFPQIFFICVKIRQEVAQPANYWSFRKGSSKRDCSTGFST